MSDQAREPLPDLPLSYDQEGRLFLESWLNMRSAPYVPFHLHGGLRLSGKIDVGALQTALNDIIERHDVLRTAFLGVIPPRLRPSLDRDGVGTGRVVRPGRDAVARSGPFRQSIVSNAPLTLTVIGLEHVPPAAVPSEIQRIASEMLAMPFDYEKPPLMRALLLRLKSTEHALIFVLHHLVGDGWSLGILGKELASRYSSLVAGRPSALQPLPAQFVDFAKWQRQRLQGDVLDRLVSHVTRNYQDFDVVQASCHDLPFARPRGGLVRTGGCETLVLGRALCEQLRTFARQKRLSLYMLLLGVFSTVVHLYTGKPRIGIWGHFANRTRPEFEQLIGWFSTFRLLSVDFSSDPAMLNMLEQTREAVLEAATYQDLPFALLWNAIKGDGKVGSRAPRVFGESHISFNFVVWSRWEWPGVSRLHPATLRTGGGERALRVTAIDDGDDITLLARYPSELLTAAGVQQMLSDVEALLETPVASPSSRTSSLLAQVASRGLTA